MKNTINIFVSLLLITVAFLAITPTLNAQNPHDGYMFWMPAGELKIGDNESQQQFQFTVDNNTHNFIAKARQTRFDHPAGQLVIIRKGNSTDKPEYTVDGQSAGKLGSVTFVPANLTKGKNSCKISVNSSWKGEYLFYITDDADKLGVELSGDAASWSKTIFLRKYGKGLLNLWSGKYSDAYTELSNASNLIDKPEGQRTVRRLSRMASAYQKYPAVKTAKGYYELGLYSMQNGFWALAVDCFNKSTTLEPKNADAWYMLANAMSYTYSDYDKNMAKIYPYYRKAADLYPRENSNTFRNFIGFFTKLRIDDKTVLNMTQEQMDYAKTTWEWDAAIVEAASKGALRMVNTYKVIDEETDNTNTWSPYPFGGHFKPGEIETYLKMTGWGASDACGPDCGPDRSAMINMGIREWDVMLHEWNHTLDWMMICSELGVGVPTTHSSDWCGLEPISTMGMGHMSCNRYYMTPGMYRYIRGSDPVTTKGINVWKVTKAVEWAKPVEKTDDVYEKSFNEKVKEPALPNGKEFTKNVITDKTNPAYIDLYATYNNEYKSPSNVYTFARTYIYSPSKQKVRMWVGADDHLRMWLNGVLIHKGIYTSVCLFQDARDPNHLSKGVTLEKGWNECIIQVTNRQYSENWIVPNPPPDSWGFGVRICDIKNTEVPGLKYSAETPSGFVMPKKEQLNPANPKTYVWKTVADDYTELLPALTVDDIKAITGYKTLTIDDKMMFDLSGEKLDPSIAKLVIKKADAKDQKLNNHLNWYFSPKEMVSVIRYKRGNQTRDLVFLRPEAYETYLQLMRVTPEAKKLGITSHSNRVIGTLMVWREDCPNGRGCIVVDTYLGDNLPKDEEELLDLNLIK